MRSQSLPNRQIACLAFALAASLLAPVAASAQNSAPKPPQSYEDTHKSVVVTVDYVEVPLTDLVKTSQWIASGEPHDGLLLAALIKNGAADTKGLPVQAWDGQTVERRYTLAASGSGGPGEPQYGDTKITPEFNADGTITVQITLESEDGTITFKNGRAVPETSAEGNQAVTRTFHDGETVKIGQNNTQAASGAYTAHLTFVQMTVTTGRVAGLMPDPYLPVDSSSVASLKALLDSVSAKPSSVDPGMVMKPSSIHDQNMAVGRGMQPGRLDHMNLGPAP